VPATLGSPPRSSLSVSIWAACAGRSTQGGNPWINQPTKRIPAKPAAAAAAVGRRLPTLPGGLIISERMKPGVDCGIGSAVLYLTLASQNGGKLRELESLITAARLPIAVRSLAQAGTLEQAEETGATFGQNALLKAAWAAHRASGWALADDSGLCVDALGGAPGIHSARWSGGGDEANNALLLEKLAGVAAEKRSARYQCALALCSSAGEMLLVEAAVEGRITTAPRGSGGFGYDPHFEIPPGHRPSPRSTWPARRASPTAPRLFASCCRSCACWPGAELGACPPPPLTSGAGSAPDREERRSCSG
jgi:XTP/dITP diphosphohydrolase